ncbi:MAG: hypothetical protein PWP72_2222 [Thermoanaerobacter sp.]|nr:hypothetical protein [Thermoanaerobacter sp.]
MGSGAPYVCLPVLTRNKGDGVGFAGGLQGAKTFVAVAAGWGLAAGHRLFFRSALCGAVLHFAALGRRYRCGDLETPI